MSESELCVLVLWTISFNKELYITTICHNLQIYRIVLSPPGMDWSLCLLLHSHWHGLTQLALLPDKCPAVKITLFCLLYLSPHALSSHWTITDILLAES